MEASEPVRIVYVIDSLGVGGAERHLVRLLRGLRGERSWHTSVYCLRSPQVPLEEATEVDVAGQTGEWSRSPHRALRSLLLLRAYLRRERPAIAHCYLVSGGVFGAIAARLAGVPHVITTRRAVHERRGVSRLRYRLATKIMDWCSDVVIAASDAARSQAVSEGTPPRKIVTILNAVGFDPLPAPRPRQRRMDAVFGCVARLAPVKGQRHLMEAVPDVLARLPGSRFVFLGDGPDRSVLERRAAELGVSSSVEFRGYQTDVMSFLQSIDVFVLASLTEGMPNSVLEAMAACVPVVATDVGGTPEVVKDGQTGLLVPPADPGALADAAVRMATDTTLRDRCVAGAHALICSRFTSERELQETVQVYERVLGGEWRAGRPRASQGHDACAERDQP